MCVESTRGKRLKVKRENQRQQTYTEDLDAAVTE